MGSYHLYASVARFTRDDERRPQKSNVDERMPEKPIAATHVASNNKVPIKQVMSQQVSFADKVKGSKGPQSKEATLDSIEVSNDDVPIDSFTVNSVFGRVRNVRLIEKLYALVIEEGFFDFVVRYVGGEWV